MSTKQKIVHALILVGVAILQLISTQLVTFLVSLLTAPLGLFKEDFPQTMPVLFVILLGLSYTIGIFGTGWLALRVHWLKIEPRHKQRLIGTLLGAYLPLLIALLFYHPMEPGNPFFFVSAITGVCSYYLAGVGR